MAFSSKRGRPKKPIPTLDEGTPELAAKRARGITTEPLDLCLERRLITPAEHRAALHLRWLYSLRFGYAGVRALALSQHETSPSRCDDPLWRAEREEDYKSALQTLAAARAQETVLKLCIFNEMPDFLRPHLQMQALTHPALASRLSAEYQTLRHGVDALVKLWQGKVF